MDLCRPMYVRILVLLLVLQPCECEERVNLTAVVGSSVIFDPVKEKGYFSFGRKTIASVFNGDFEIDEKIYSNRLNWNSSGHFILSDLQKSDSGSYIIDSKKGTVFHKLYELKVYDPVSVPVVSCLNTSEGSCSVQCSVTRTEQTTLSWFRGEQRLNSSRSGVLPLNVQLRDYNISYKCVSENPADTKTSTVNIATVCKNNERQTTEDTSGTRKAPYLYVLIPIALLVLLGCIVMIYRKKSSQKESRTLHAQDSVQYAQIMHRKRKDDQPCNTSNPSGSPSRPDLTTVYDKIQRERMTPTYSNCGEIT